MSMLPGKGLFPLHVGKERDLCLLEKAPDKDPRIRLNLFQMVLAAEALRVDLVDCLRARWAGGEPSILGDHLDAADGLVVAGRPVSVASIRLAAKVLGVKLFWGQRCEPFLLIGRSGRIDALIEGPAQVLVLGR